MTNVIDLNQKKAEKELTTLSDIIESFTSNNCDPNRPYLCQQPLRGQMEIKGLTRRDIEDCMVLGILTCKAEEELKENDKLACVYLSEKGSKFSNIEDLIKSGEGYKDHYLDETKITYNDLFGWDLNAIDPVAAVQNMACYLERRMGIYPALLDGKLESKEDTEAKTS